MFGRKKLKQMLGCVMATTMALIGVQVNSRTENTSLKVAYANETLTYTEENSTYTYTELSDGTLEISDYEGTDVKIMIPEEIVGKKVTKIGYSAFYGCSSLEEIVIPEGVTGIGVSAFVGCSSLEEIIIPEGVTYIGHNAFYDCSSLEEITIPKGVTEISVYTFSGCSSLKRIIISEGVIVINDAAFNGCSSLEEITIPESVTKIGQYAFQDCSNLKEIIIPEGVEFIGHDVFKGCNNLEKIEVSEENLNYKSESGVLFNKNMTWLIQYPTGKTDVKYIIPEGVTEIDWFAFSGCSSLEKITIPEGVTEIGCAAFRDCSSLEEIVILESVIELELDVFLNCSNLTIYSKKDSCAETYAKKENIPFIAINKITSLDNITVIYPIDSIKRVVSLQTKKLTQEDEEYKKINFEEKIMDSSVSAEEVIFIAYDVSLVDENNNKVQPSQVVTVKIPYIEGYDKEKSNIYRVNDNGTFTDMKAMCEGEYFVFETNHLSTYIITETKLVTNPDVILGDVNGDGEVDIKDSALIKRYLAGVEVELNLEAADVNVDGEVSIKDSALVKRQLAGW